MNNPPAFPTSHEEPDDYNGHNNSKKTVIDQGMTLRDYFAAQAMQALLRQYPDHLMNSPASEVASDAYSMADAMMKAREA
jgi:hypothetical protein